MVSAKNVQRGRNLPIRDSGYQVPGRNHLPVASPCLNIGNVYLVQKKYPEALEMYQKCLKIKTKVLGPDHLDVAKTQSNIAIIFQQQGKYPEVLEIYH